MAVSKKFMELVSKVIGSNVGELLRQIGEESVKQCYTAGKADCAQYALDTLPDVWRNPLATWLRARGIIVSQKAVGTSRFIVGEDGKLVKSQKRQERAFAEAKTELVLATESQSVRQPRKEKKIDAALEERVRKASASFIARVKKDDPDAAAVLNDRLTRKVSLVDELEPSAAEIEAAVQTIMLMRMEGGKLRRAA